ncbi:MAG: thiamine-phosphate kinase [Vibrio sp.]
MAGEFDLIARYFANQQANRDDVALALGDDCAVLNPPAEQQIVISTDTCVAGTHFLADADPAWIAHKSLASNLSDLAAMGATPAWLSLALTLPKQDTKQTQAWLDSFCPAMFKLANQHQLQLIGGDTTQGPLAVSFTIHGFVPSGKALYRSGAQAGDLIYVSGDLGQSQAGLDIILDPNKNHKPNAHELIQAHFMATPRIELGQALRGIATSCIDISDGLVSDLAHILKASNLDARLDVENLPIDAKVTSFYDTLSLAQKAALTSGEEYELCFSVPEKYTDRLKAISDETQTPIHCIGRCLTQTTAEPAIALHFEGKALDWQLNGFDHFINQPKSRLD